MLATEQEIIDTLTRHCRPREDVLVGIGDDAAVLRGDELQIAAHDLLVEGVHFRRATATSADIGHKALAVNLSDLAAMGARPRTALVGLGVPPDLTLAEVDAMYAGMDALAAGFDVSIVGGDVSAAPVLMLAVTVLGTMSGDLLPVLRSGAQPGDRICVTGTFGAAAAGLAVMEGHVESGRSPKRLIDRLNRPVPRVAAGQALAIAGAHAMMDCSDGIAIDLGRMALASAAAFTLDLVAVPVAPGVADVARAQSVPVDEFAATGGEDYELIVCLPPQAVAAARAALAVLDVPLTEVGEVRRGAPGLRVTRGTTPVALTRPGWQHHTAT